MRFLASEKCKISPDIVLHQKSSPLSKSLLVVSNNLNDERRNRAPSESQLDGISAARSNKCRAMKNVREMCLYLDLKLDGGLACPFLIQNVEVGRIDRQWQLTSKYAPFGNRLLGRWQLKDLEILFRFLKPAGSQPIYFQVNFEVTTSIVLVESYRYRKTIRAFITVKFMCSPPRYDYDVNGISIDGEAKALASDSVFIAKSLRNILSCADDAVAFWKANFLSYWMYSSWFINIKKLPFWPTHLLHCRRHLMSSQMTLVKFFIPNRNNCLRTTMSPTKVYSILWTTPCTNKKLKCLLPPGPSHSSLRDSLSMKI